MEPDGHTWTQIPHGQLGGRRADESLGRPAAEDVDPVQQRLVLHDEGGGDDALATPAMDADLEHRRTFPSATSSEPPTTSRGPVPKVPCDQAHDLKR